MLAAVSNSDTNPNAIEKNLRPNKLSCIQPQRERKRETEHKKQRKELKRISNCHCQGNAPSTDHLPTHAPLGGVSIEAVAVPGADVDVNINVEWHLGRLQELWLCRSRRPA